MFHLHFQSCHYNGTDFVLSVQHVVTVGMLDVVVVFWKQDNERGLN